MDVVTPKHMHNQQSLYTKQVLRFTVDGLSYPYGINLTFAREISYNKRSKLITYVTGATLNNLSDSCKNEGNVANISSSFNFDFENLEVGVCLNMINFTINCLEISVLLQVSCTLANAHSILLVFFSLPMIRKSISTKKLKCLPLENTFIKIRYCCFQILF